MNITPVLTIAIFKDGKQLKEQFASGGTLERLILDLTKPDETADRPGAAGGEGNAPPPPEGTR